MILILLNKHLRKICVSLFKFSYMEQSLLLIILNNKNSITILLKFHFYIKFHISIFSLFKFNSLLKLHCTFYSILILRNSSLKVS